MAERKPATERHCTHASLESRGAIALPVLTEHGPKGKIRASRNGRRRAIVLVTVQLVMIAHVVVWLLGRKYGWFGGQTLTPVEPSESMEFVKHGVINAGLIFFALALLGTLIFGRFFCGWGCHVVMLQDFCSWIMKKCGVRPKAFRSRFLIYVPLLLALYMFVWPAVYRWAVIPASQALAERWSAIPNLADAPAWGLQTHLTTGEFWKTFPGLMVAIPFLFVCGFATVYFLGAKGFCTYGCPYGGFFAPIDKLALGKIRVTDACEGCGHCTAVCSSNVRVHEEVREFGMVVDPGCMKCMDCVSVCPNDALYFGFGKPTVMKGPAKTAAPKRVYDLTLREEFAFAAVFLLAFFSVRGVYHAVPMLMAAGVAGVLTFIAWKAWRLVRDPNVTLHRFQLKLKGAMKPAGWGFAAATIVALALTAHSGVVNAAVALADYHNGKVQVAQEALFAPNPPALLPEQAAHADRAAEWYRFASFVGDGGIGLLSTWQGELDLRAARMHAAKLDFAAAENLLRESMRRHGPSDGLAVSVFWTMRAQQRAAEALDFAEQMLLKNAGFNETFNTFIQFTAMAGDFERGLRVTRAHVERFPDDVHALQWLGRMELERGDLAEGVKVLERAVEIDRNTAGSHYLLALGLADLGRTSEAVPFMIRAAKLAPDDAAINGVAADFLTTAGRPDEAAKCRGRLEKARARHDRATPATSQH